MDSQVSIGSPSQKSVKMPSVTAKDTNPRLSKTQTVGAAHVKEKLKSRSPESRLKVESQSSSAKK